MHRLHKYCSFNNNMYGWMLLSNTLGTFIREELSFFVRLDKPWWYPVLYDFRKKYLSLTCNICLVLYLVCHLLWRENSLLLAFCLLVLDNIQNPHFGGQQKAFIGKRGQSRRKLDKINRVGIRDGNENSMLPKWLMLQYGWYQDIQYHLDFMPRRNYSCMVHNRYFNLEL